MDDSGHRCCQLGANVIRNVVADVCSGLCRHSETAQFPADRYPSAPTTTAMMTAPSCGILFSPSQRIDRRTSVRRSLSLNKKSTVSGRPPVTSLRGPEMGFSPGHNLALSDKMRQLQARKKREQDILAGKSQPAAVHPPAMRRNPRHMDLMEAASQKEREARHTKKGETYRPQVGVGKENEYLGAKRPEESVHSYNLHQSYRQIAYNQYLEEAFGLNANQRPKPAAVQRLRPSEALVARPDSDASARSTDSMEVNFHMSSKDIPSPSILSAKDRRPKIQVTIPGKSTTAPPTKHLIHQLNRSKTNGRARERQTDVSPPSSTTQQKQSGEAPARLSIVSPLSVVEMPKPRRPFSAFSLEDMTSDMPKEGTGKDASSHGRSTSSGSDDTSHEDDMTSNYSPRSSMSSLSDGIVQEKTSDDRRSSLAFSIINPATAGVFDNLPLVPKASKQHLKSNKGKAALTLNTNKPLPPEPGMEDVEPLNLPGQPHTRNSMHGKRKAPTPLTISRSSTIDVPSHFPSRVSSLRSKYTPADLDALDAAFVQSSPQATFHHKQSSLEQAEQELEAQLGTIEEDEGISSGVVPLVHDPLQISRGPNHMVPMRQAPPPPTSSIVKLSDGSTSSRKRLNKKPSVHVAMQMKTEHGKDAGDLRRQISAPLSAASKAHRILGKTDTSDQGTPMRREASSESNWSSSDSPETSYGTSSSPDMSSRENTGTPETDVSSIPDPAFEEVKARLELLSPKNDSLPYRSAFSRDHNDSDATPRLGPNQAHSVESARSKPSAPSFHVSSDSRSDIPIRLDAPGDQDDEDTAGRRGRTFQDDARSLASIAMSEIPDMYAELPPPLPSPVPMMRDEGSAEEIDCVISADAAEKVLLRILQNLDNLQDLFACATVSRGFYRTFKRHELPLMKNALYGMSPAAWELREMSVPYPGLNAADNAFPRLDYDPTLYLQHYMRDMYTMIALKSMILIHCESFLRTDTITALAGGETERASQIDDAFWRVWTFCQIFGCGNNREDDIAGQMDWLRGGVQARYQARNAVGDSSHVKRNSILVNPPTSFGRGNAGGLSAEELYDMTEIWTCLGVLVRGFQGKRQEARDAGIYDNADITSGDVEVEDSVLEEWTYHLMTLAPPTVLDVTSPTSPTASTFAHARSRGYTDWTPPAISRATFLKEAVSRVYQEKIAEVHTNSAPSSPRANITTPSIESSTTPPNLDEGPVNESIAARWRCARHAAEIRAKRNDPNFSALPHSEERPMSEYPNVLAKLDARDMPPVPTHRATLSEMDTAKHMISALVVPAGPQVRDPVDVAVDKLVAMGFEASKAKKALAETDTGNSVDFDGALEQLVRERKRDVNGLMHVGYRGKAEERGLKYGQSMIQGEDLVSPVHGEVGIGLGLSGVTRF